VDMATVGELAAEVEPYVRADSTRIWSLMHLERQLRPEAYERRRAATSTVDPLRPQMGRVHALARLVGSSASRNPDCSMMAASLAARSRRRFSRWYCARAQVLEQ